MLRRSNIFRASNRPCFLHHRKVLQHAHRQPEYRQLRCTKDQEGEGKQMPAPEPKDANASARRTERLERARLNPCRVFESASTLRTKRSWWRRILLIFHFRINISLAAGASPKLKARDHTASNRRGHMRGGGKRPSVLVAPCPETRQSTILCCVQLSYLGYVR